MQAAAVAKGRGELIHLLGQPPQDVHGDGHVEVLAVGLVRRLPNRKLVVDRCSPWVNLPGHLLDADRNLVREDDPLVLGRLGVGVPLPTILLVDVAHRNGTRLLGEINRLSLSLGGTGRRGRRELGPLRRDQS